MRHNSAKVLVHGLDPVSQAGLAAQLRGRPGVELVDDVSKDTDVALVGVDRIDDDAIQAVHTLQCNGCRSVMVLAAEVDESAVLRAVEEGVVGVIKRADATPERLAEAIDSAHAGGGSLSNDLLGGLLRQVRQVHQNVLVPKGLSFSGLSDREAEVLKLVADGLDTREIASELCYSERTIKNVIQDIVRRFGLRNRSHAVAFALRQGFI